MSAFCLKSSNSSKANPRRDCLDEGEDSRSLVECDFLSIGFSEEFCAGNVYAAVKGRLKSSVSFWASTLDAPQFTLDTILHGYRIPFASYPAPCFLSNNLSALRHPDFVVHAISELLDNGCITEHSEPPFCVNPLTVAEGKKLRLVIDLRHVNCHLVRFKFKYEDLRSLSQVLQEGHWFFTWDLKSGYHHVDISPDHQKYLGFAWPFDGVLRYFTFSVYPSVSVARVFVLPNCCARWLNAGDLWVITLLFISTTVLVASQRGRPPSQQLLFSERNLTLPVSLLTRRSLTGSRCKLASGSVL